MDYLTLEQMKRHLNIDLDYDADDEYIAQLGDVAEQIVKKHLECDLSDLASKNGGGLPAPVIHAMLLFVGNMYLNRESVAAVQFHQIPMAYEYLIGLYKNYEGFQG